jgi:hypothetical protein
MSAETSALLDSLGGWIYNRQTILSVFILNAQLPDQPQELLDSALVEQ